MPGLGDMDGLGGEEGDDEMPDLEEEEEGAADAGKGKGKETADAPKIEEVS